VSAVRSIAALSIVGAALTFAALGVVRGAMHAGPGSGTRLTVAIGQPVDEAAQTIATHVVRDRLDEKGSEVRIVPAGDKLVVEVGTTDRELVAIQAELIERVGKLEVHRFDATSLLFASITPTDGIRVESGIPVAEDRRVLAEGLAHLTVTGDRVIAYGRVGEAWRPYVLERPVLLDGTQVRRVDVLDEGVAITVAQPSAITVGVPIAVVFDGVVHFVGAADRIEGSLLHVPASAEAAVELVSIVEAGAVHPLRVVDRAEFSRATGFLPRAWPFLAIGGALLIVAALVWWSGRRAR
jgi:hypothetical protein